jgi:hypothetical protein
MIYRDFLELRRIILIRYAMDRIFCELLGFIIKNYKMIKRVATAFEAIFGPISPYIKKWVLKLIRKFLIFSTKHYAKRLFQYGKHAISIKRFVVTYLMLEVRNIAQLVEHYL